MMLIVDKRYVVLEWKTTNSNVYIEDTVDLQTRIDLTRKLNQGAYDVVVEPIPEGVLKDLVHEKVTSFWLYQLKRQWFIMSELERYQSFYLWRVF